MLVNPSYNAVDIVRTGCMTSLHSSVKPQSKHMLTTHERTFEAKELYGSQEQQLDRGAIQLYLVVRDMLLEHEWIASSPLHGQEKLTMQGSNVM
ncbi:hypothetical protein B7453_27995 [Pseudomonas sp. IB20]|nr:hypothetical protein B7453_27995 [Pseudomonas sp. IB20]